MRMTLKGFLAMSWAVLFLFFSFSAYAAALVKTYTDIKFEYSIKYPAAYNVKKLRDAVIFLSNTKDKKFAFAPNVNVSAEILAREVEDPAAFYENAKKSLTENMSDVYFLEQKKEKLDGKDVYKLVYTSKQQKAVFKSMQVMLINNKKVYVLTCTALDSQYNDYLPEAKAIINSFKITK